MGEVKNTFNEAHVLLASVKNFQNQFLLSSKSRWMSVLSDSHLLSNRISHLTKWMDDLTCLISLVKFIEEHLLKILFVLSGFKSTD